jgi:hypothetical protein
MTYSNNKAVGGTVLDVLGVTTDRTDGVLAADPGFPWSLRPGLRPGCTLSLAEIQAYATANNTTVAALVATPGIQAAGPANTYIITESAVPA